MLVNEYKVYLIREKFTHEIKYIGLTRQSLQKRFDAHVARFKFNRAHYQIELVVDELNITQAAELEKMLIKQYDLLNLGWNKSPGSINGFSNYHSEEQKNLWSKNRKGKCVSKEHADKNRKARLGKKNSKEHERKIIESIQKPVMCLNTGEIFTSGRHAAEKLNLSRSKISLVCHGKRSHTKGYKFIFIKNKSS